MVQELLLGFLFELFENFQWVGFNPSIYNKRLYKNYELCSLHPFVNRYNYQNTNVQMIYNDYSNKYYNINYTKQKKNLYSSD